MVVRDGGLQGQDLLKNGCVGWDHRDKMDGALRNLLITCRFSVFSWWFQLKSVFLQQIFEHYIRLYYDVRY